MPHSLVNGRGRETMKTKNWVIAGLLTAGGMIAGAGIEVQAKENKEVFDLPDEDQFLAETSESAVMEESRTDGTEKEEIPKYDGCGDLSGKDGAEETGEKDDTDPVTFEADKDKTDAVEESLENEGSADLSNGVYEAVVPVQTLTAKAPVSIMVSPVSEKNGWNNDRTSYYANGKMVTGEKFIDGFWYHFDAAGNRTSSSFVDLTDNGKTRTVYYNAQGQMLYGQQQLDKDWYCFDLGNGNMFRGLSRLTRAYEPAGEKTVYYDPASGKMRYGEIQVGGEWRYFLPGWGTMAVNQEITVQNSVSNGGKTARYYYRGDGTKQKGEAKIGNGWKCYDSRTGAMKTGFVDLTKAEYKTNEDKRVYYDRNGYMIYGQQQIDGSWYCFDLGTGKMKTGLTKLSKVYEPAGEKTVYYDPGTGKMQYGVIEVGDRVYTFAQGTGAKQNGTIRSETAEGKRGLIFYGADGLKKTGQQTLNGKWYFFNPENHGFAQVGLFTLDKRYEQAGAKTVYYNPDGTMYYGQKQIDEKWKWFKLGSGSMAISEFISIPAAYNSGTAKICYYDANGNMVYGNHTFGPAMLTFNNQTGSLVKSNINNVHYLSQRDPRWAYVVIGNSNITNSGCVPTVQAMILNALLNQNYLPTTVAQVLYQNGVMNRTNTGASAGAHEVVSQKYGVKVTPLQSVTELSAHLLKGGMIAAAMNPGIFTVYGYTHEILIYGYDNGMVNVMDPYNSGNNGKYTLATIFEQRSTDSYDYKYGTPFFGYGIL